MQTFSLISDNQGGGRWWTAWLAVACFVPSLVLATGLDGWPAQERQQSAHSGRAGAMAVDAAGNVYLAGLDGDQLVVTKQVAATGAVAWTAAIDPLPGQAKSVLAMNLDPSGNPILTVTNSIAFSNPTTAATLKVSAATGGVLWTGTKSMWAKAQAVDASGAAVVVGAAGSDALAVKYGSGGGEVWSRTVANEKPGALSTTEVATFNAVTTRLDGTVIVAGRANKLVSLNTYKVGGYVAMLNAGTGEITWERRYDTGTPIINAFSHVIVDGMGLPVVGARARLDDGAPTFASDFFVSKLQWTNGTTVWTYTDSGTYAGGVDMVTALRLINGGDILFTGLSQNADLSTSLFVRRLAGGSGSVLWHRRLDGWNESVWTPSVSDVQVHSSGDVVIGMVRMGSVTGETQTMVLSAADGTNKWEHVLPWPQDHPYTPPVTGKAFAGFDAGGLPIVGWTQGAGTLSGSSVIHSYAMTAQKVGVSGLGPPVLAVLDGAAAVPNLGTVSLGTAEVGTVISRTITLQNTGNADLMLRNSSYNVNNRAVDVSGTHGADVAVGPPGSLWLKPGESTTFAVHFTPSVAGSRTAQVAVFTSNAGSSSFHVTCIGTEPDITLTQGTNTLVNGSEVDVGDVLRGSPVQRTFTITNDGTAPLTGLAVSSTLTPGYGDLSIGALGGTTLAPAESTTFTIGFTPTASGVIQVPLRLVSNDRDEGIINFTFRVNSLYRSLTVRDGTALLTSGVSVVNIGYVYPTGSRVITLQNTGNSDLTVSDVSLSGANSADFSISGPVSSVVGSNLSTTFTVHCTPSAPGQRAATVTILSDTMPAGSFLFDVLANQVTAEAEVSLYQGAVLSNGGATQSFGTVALGAAVKRDFVISSIGTATLSNLTVSVIGTHASEVTVTQPGKTSMVPGETTGFSATFAPGALGLRTAILRIVSNDMSDDPFDIPISITGASAGLSLEHPEGSALEAGATVPFGEVLIGSENMQTFWVRNTGAVDLQSIVISVEGTNANEVELTGNDFFMVEPGHVSAFDLTWKPTAAGTRTATLRVVSSDAGRSPFLVNLTCTGKSPQPQIDVQYPFGNSLTSGATINFGTHLVDDEQVENVTIFNIGPADLTNIAVTKSGTGADDFTFGLEQDEGGASKVILSKDENQYLWVAFRPSTSGARTATLSITSNDAARSPFLVQLSGVGQPRLPQLAVSEEPAGPNLASGATITFPNMVINGTDGPWTEKAYRIRNLGAADLTGISVTKGGAAADEVTFGTYSGTIPTTLAPGAQFTLWVKFWVKTEGPRQAQINVASNDPTSNPFTLNLASTGLPAPMPAIDVVALPEDVEVGNGDTYDFGNVVVGSTGVETKKYFEVTNDGTALLTNIKFWVIGENASDYTVGSDLGPIPSVLALDPGESVQFWVKVKTTTAGPREATIKVTSNAPQDSPFLVNVRANIIVTGSPQLRMEELPGGAVVASGTSINFGEMIPNDGIGVEKTFRVVNSGTGLMTGLNVAVSGDPSADVSIIPVSVPMPADLAAGGSWEFKLKFVAGAEGTRNAQLNVTSTSAGVAAFQAPLTAVGLPSTPVLRVLELPNQVAKASGSTLQFDAMVAGEDGGVWAKRSIRLHNASSVTFTGLDIDVTGTHAAEVTFGPESTPIPADLGPNEYVDVWIRFDVAALGERSATLEVRSSAPAVPLYVLNLRSNGAGWDAFAPGLYDGLLHDQAGGELVGSLSTITVSKASVASGFAGVATGTLRMKGRNASIKGNFLSDGTLTSTLNQTDGSAVVLNLHLEQGNGTLAGGAVRIVGTVTWQGVTADAVARKIPYNGTSFKAPVSQRGAFTFLMPSQGSWPAGSPRGEGWMTGTMSTSGRIALVGCLGDGTRFTKTCLLSGDGELALYQELYRTVPIKGCIGGVMMNRDVPGVSDADGSFQWIKLADARELMHSGGFDLDVQVIGSRFTPPLAGVRSLAQLADEEYNSTFNFVGATLPQSEGWFTRVASWKKDDQVIHYGPETLKATVSRSTGGMTGSYLDPVSGRSISFTGVAFQKQGLAAGCLVTNNRDGSVIVLPDTAFPYPGSESAGALLLPGVLASIAVPPAVSDVAPWVSAASGTFLGLLQDPADQLAGALESFALSSTGSFTGALRINTTRYPIINKFITSTGRVTFNIIRKGTTPIVVTLQLVRENADPAGYQVQGTVSVDGVTFDLAAQRLPKYLKTDRSPHEGVYTLAMMAPNGVDPYAEPGGHGHATLAVSYLGKCTGTLTLPEGTTTTFAGHVSRQGQWSFYRTLYGTTPKGFIGGLITFRDEAGLSDLDGDWRWVKLPGAAPTTTYPSGFDSTRSVIGSRYTAPLAGQRAMGGLNDEHYNAWFRLSGPDYSASAALALSELDRAITWNTSNKILYWGPDKLVTTFSAATGGLTGTYTYKDDFASVPFTGVLLQKQNLVVGKYGSQGKSGSFSIQARAD